MKITRKGKFIRRMEPFDYFGEAALFHSSTRFATATAETDLMMLVMTTEAISELGGNKF